MIKILHKDTDLEASPTYHGESSNLSSGGFYIDPETGVVVELIRVDCEESYMESRHDLCWTLTTDEETP